MSFLYRLLRLLGHQGWVRFGIRSRIIKFFINPERRVNFKFKVDYFGAIYPGSLDNLVDYNVYFFGALEKGMLFLLKDLAQKKDDTIFLDIGANVGTHSLFMSRFCKTVHAFEPYPVVADLLEEKLKINNIHNVFLHRVGLGDKNETLDFMIPPRSNLGMGRFFKNTTKTGCPQEKRSLANADEYIAGLNLESIDIIKIDVEDFEKYLLLGLQGTLKKYRPTVIMEFTKETQDKIKDKNEFLSLLPGYKVSEVIWDRSVLAFFNNERYRIIDFEFFGGFKILLCVPL